MAKTLDRSPRKFDFDEFLSTKVDLPHKLELIDGIIGPFSNRAKLALLANWGTDAIIKLTGPDVWIEALEAAKRKT